MRRTAAAALLGAGLWVASCAPATGEDVSGRAHDAARSDEMSSTGAGGDDGAQPTDASGGIDVAMARDVGGADEDRPLDARVIDPDGGIDEDARGEADAPGAVWQNGLGMRFVPVPGTNVWFAIWETRVQDYEAYARATGTPIPQPDFAETALQPKAAVSRAQAESFAVWLTDEEKKDGLLGPSHAYRLPTDREWDVAMEVGATGGPYPWGAGFPPPDRFANYGITNDGFTYTSPVGTFAPNRFGLYDMAGNLWEWIGEGCAAGGAYLVRGCGWNAAHEPYFVLSFHYCFAGDLVGHHNVGFRVVLEGGRPTSTPPHT